MQISPSKSLLQALSNLLQGPSARVRGPVVSLPPAAPGHPGTVRTIPAPGQIIEFAMPDPDLPIRRGMLLDILV